MTIQLGELKGYQCRLVWPHEERDFSPWLGENLGLLGEALGMDLELSGLEVPTGAYRCDLLARDLASDRVVVIENQFGSTNPEHLGKILTYAAGLEAEAIVWLAEEIREEHRQTLEWLNRHTDETIRLFAVKLELLQIDDSAPAVNFRVVVFPNAWQRAVREAAAGRTTARGEAYRTFFQALLDELREQHRFTNARIAQPHSWYAFASGVSGVQHSVSFTQGARVRTEIYIDLGDLEANKALFDRLRMRAEELETALGETLTWERLDEKRASRIAAYREGSIEASAQELSDIHSWAIAMLLKFRDVFVPVVREEVQSG